MTAYLSFSRLIALVVLLVVLGCSLWGHLTLSLMAWLLGALAVAILLHWPGPNV